MENIFNYPKKDLEDYLVAKGYKKFLASQIFDWLYNKQEYDFNNYTNIKKETIDFLKATFSTAFITITKVEEDTDVKKFLFTLKDGQKIESVLMYHNYGLSVCVSSQVGCNMGCKFCESGRLKKVRDLETYEMLEQAIAISNYVKQKIDSVVIMGIGEPFDNFTNVMKFINLLNDPKVLAIGARHITVSTCGLVPKIKAFADMELQVNLALSLHSPTDEKRKQIMNVAKAYSLKEVFEALRYYQNKTKRRVTIEYIMLDKINDTKEDALALSKLLNGYNVYVNLIPYNETKNIAFKASSKKQIALFYDTLKKNGLDVTVRHKFGNKISAACGQLRSKEI